jgi:hypothetical protein
MFETLLQAVEERAEKRVKPLVMGAIALGLLGAVAGTAGLVVAMRR